MKPWLTSLLLLLVAVLFSPSSDGAEAVAVPENHAGYLFQVDHKTVAILPGLPPDQMSINSDKVVRLDADTLELSGVKIVITVPGHAPLTIAGDRLTLVLQK